MNTPCHLISPLRKPSPIFPSTKLTQACSRDWRRSAWPTWASRMISNGMSFENDSSKITRERTASSRSRAMMSWSQTTPSSTTRTSRSSSPSRPDRSRPLPPKLTLAPSIFPIPGRFIPPRWAGTRTPSSQRLKSPPSNTPSRRKPWAASPKPGPLAMALSAPSSKARPAKPTRAKT